MAEKSELEKRMESEGLRGHRITNNDLQCKDCKFRRDDFEIFGNVSKCDVYPVHKPNKVMAGQNCNFYEKGEENEY